MQVLLGGAAEPLGSFPRVLRNLLSLQQEHAQLELGLGILLLRASPIPGRRLDVILAYALPLRVEVTQMLLRRGGALCRLLLDLLDLDFGTGLRRTFEGGSLCRRRSEPAREEAENRKQHKLRANLGLHKAPRRCR